MKIIFMGSPIFATYSLKSLLQEKNLEVICVYSQPPRAAKRGQHLRNTAVHDLAIQNNIQVRTPINFKDPIEIEKFKELQADLAIVSAYGLLLPEAILSAPKFGCINVHASLLPKWRGAAPIHRAIEHGDLKTGICIMQMTKGLDMGNILNSYEIPINHKTTYDSLHAQLAQLSYDILPETINNLERYSSQSIMQDHSIASYASKIKKEETKLNFHKDNAQILERKIRAFNSIPATYIEYENNKNKKYRLKIYDASVVQDESLKLDAGQIFSTEHCVYIGCNENSILSLKEVQKSGSKKVDITEFLKGNKILLLNR